VVALLLAGFLAYRNSFAGQFVFDDNHFVKEVQTYALWKQFLLAPGGLARPLVSLSLAANYFCGGLAPFGYHVFNLAIHLLAALTLFSVLRRTFCLLRFGGHDLDSGDSFGGHDHYSCGIGSCPPKLAGWLALAASLLWLVHPLQTESVTYIIRRGEALAGLFYLLALYCVIRGAQSDENTTAVVPPAGEAEPNDDAASHPASSSISWYILAVFSCLAGAACGPVIVTAPLVIFAYDRIFFAGSIEAAWSKRRGLYLGLAAVWPLLVALIYFSGPLTAASFGLGELAPIVYAKSQCVVLLHYLRLAFYPVGLCLDYLWPEAQSRREFLPGALAIGLLLLATVWAWFRRPTWSFPCIWFFVILAPTSSFVPLENLAFEHRLYLPLAAIAALVVVAGYLAGKAVLRRLADETWRRVGALAAAGAVLAVSVLLGRLTYQRNKDYSSPLAMLQDILAKRPYNWRACNGMGLELCGQGKYAEALGYFNKALTINPHSAEAYYNRGLLNLSKGDISGTLADFDQAISFNPPNAEIYYSRGAVRERKGDSEGALADYNRALDLNPSFAAAYHGRGMVHMRDGDYAGATAEFNKALSFNPNNAVVHASLGNALLEMCSFDQAIVHFTQALAASPNSAELYNNRGNARLKKGDNDGALADYNQALKINPAYSHGYSGRALVRENQGNYDEALADFDKALDRERLNWRAWIGKGLTLVKTGREMEADHCFYEGLKINPGLADYIKSMIGQAREEAEQKAQEKNSRH